MNSRLSPHIEAVMRLILEKGPDAALHYVEQNITPEVTKAKKEFEARAQEETAAKNIIFMASSGVGFSGESSQPPREDLPLDSRGQVLAIAAEIARSNNGIAELASVVDAVVTKGIDLKSSRPGTSIANILFKVPALWERVSPGVFRLIS